MGKLLQKLVTGIVPSWLTKIKSSAEASPKKLLPYFKGNTHASSPPSSSAQHNTGVLLHAAFDNADQSIEDEEEPPPDSTACAESPVLQANSSAATQEGTTSLKQRAHRTFDETQDRRRRDRNDTHHPHHVDVKTHKNQGMHEHGANPSIPSGIPSSRMQETTSVQKGEHYHHTQQYQRNGKNQLGLEMRNQNMPEADNRHYQEGRRRHHNVNHMQLGSFFQLEREDSGCMQKGNHHNHHDKELSRHNHHDKEHSDDAEIEEEHYRKLYHDLLGLKRKSQYLEEEEEEELEEEEERGSYGSGDIDTTGWGWKRRRKAERGLMSCELPESIRCIVGNGKAVVKHSQDPHMALWESMVEMIVGNGLWELGSLEFLLFCYLSLNEPHLHPLIQSSFLQVLKDLEKT